MHICKCRLPPTPRTTEDFWTRGRLAPNLCYRQEASQPHLKVRSGQKLPAREGESWRLRNDKILNLALKPPQGSCVQKAGSSVVPEGPAEDEMPTRVKRCLLWENSPCVSSMSSLRPSGLELTIPLKEPRPRKREGSILKSGLGFRAIAACFRTRKWCLRMCITLFLV